MARPVDTDKRRKLARRAVGVLQREGLDIPMSRLAEALGMKRPTLLYYFPDRGSIANAALEDLLTEQTIYVVRKMHEHDHPLDQLFAQVKAIHSFHHGKEARLAFLAQAIAMASRKRMGDIIRTGNRVFEIHRHAMLASLQQAIEHGTMKPCDPAALMAIVRSVNDGLIVQRVMTGLDLEPVHQFLWDHILAPLKVEPS